MIKDIYIYKYIKSTAKYKLKAKSQNGTDVVGIALCEKENWI